MNILRKMKLIYQIICRLLVVNLRFTPRSTKADISPKAGVLTVRLVQIPRSILGEGFELKDYKTPRDVTVGKKETVAFDSSNVEKNESLKGTRNLVPQPSTLTLYHCVPLVSHFDPLPNSCWKPKNPISHLRATLYGRDLTSVLVLLCCAHISAP